MITINDFWYSKGEQAFNASYTDDSAPVSFPHLRSIFTSFKGALAELMAEFPNALIPDHYKTVTRPQITDL